MEKVRNRLLRATAALEIAAVPYAVIGGNALAAWVARVDEGAVRNTQDVDILLRRTDLPAARAALEKAGFTYRHTALFDMFLDGPMAKARRRIFSLCQREGATGISAADAGCNGSGARAGLADVNTRRPGSHGAHVVPAEGPSPHS